MAIIKIKNAAIDLDAAEIPNLPASKITSGTFVDARIADLSATKLTGTVATARLGSGTASGTTFLAGDQTYKTAATEFNDDKLVNDISTLALHQATNNNSAKYNLTNSNVDVYQDSSAIANLVNCSRDTSGEYVSSVSGSQYERATITGLSSGGGNINGLVLSNTASAITKTKDAVEGSTTDVNSYSSLAYTINSSISGYVIADLGASYSISQLIIGKNRGHGDGRSIKFNYSTSQSNPYSSGSNVNFTNAVSSVYSYKGSSASSSNLSNFSSSGTADWAAIGTNGDGVVCKVNGFTPFTARYISYKFGSADFHDANAGWTEFDIYKSSLIQSATGNYQSTAQTANSSVNKISAVVTYTNASGTNTLNTDIILQVSANNGSTFTNAPLTAAGTFSTGVLQAVTNDISVTAGTQLKYKIFFANQSSGSKVARINGVSLSY